MKYKRLVRIIIIAFVLIPFIIGCSSSKPLTEFSDEDLQKSLLTSNDLTFTGLHQPDDWKACSENELHDAFTEDHGNNAYQIDSAVQIVITRLYTSEECYGSGDTTVEEGLFLFSNTRQAQRFLDAAKIQAETLPFNPYDILTTNSNSYQFWIMRDKTDFEASTLITQMDEVVVIVFVFNRTKLTVDDISQLGVMAINNIRVVQKESQ